VLKIYLIRHGQNKDNADGILNGHRDEPLTDIGIAQADEIAEKIRTLNIAFDHVYASPLCRASKTAEIVCKALGLPEPEIEQDLIERNFGEMTGKLISQIPELCAPDILVTNTITYFLKYEGAETFPELLARATRLLNKLKAQHIDGNILLVTHGDIGKMIYAVYYDLDWLAVLKLFHFGNSELLELSADSSAEQTHVHQIVQVNL
jgi:broad specificity phosphatase PhoE